MKEDFVFALFDGHSDLEQLGNDGRRLGYTSAVCCSASE